MGSPTLSHWEFSRWFNNEEKGSLTVVQDTLWDTQALVFVWYRNACSMKLSSTQPFLYGSWQKCKKITKYFKIAQIHWPDLSLSVYLKFKYGSFTPGKYLNDRFLRCTGTHSHRRLTQYTGSLGLLLWGFTTAFVLYAAWVYSAALGDLESQPAGNGARLGFHTDDCRSKPPGGEQL